MKIDRARAQKAFADYSAHYNAADPKVKLKIDHTYRVAALCDCIAKSLTGGCGSGLAFRYAARCRPL